MEKEKYVFYQYLKFIWRKKWFLIAVTIVFMLLGFLFSLRSPATYVGHALVFTGNANNDKLSKPELIRTNYKNLLSNGSLTVKVPGPFQVTLDITDKTQQGTEQQIKKVVNKYVGDLKRTYNLQFSARNNYAKALTQRIGQIKQLTKDYHLQIEQNTNEQKLAYFTEATSQQEGYLANYNEKLSKVNYQISLMEEPKLMDVTTASISNNSFRNAILGAAFGFQLMLIILVIWKYILDAKRVLSS